MPAVISPKRGQAPLVYAPRRVALAVQPELERETIPVHVTLRGKEPPFSGELREEQTGPQLLVPVGGEAVLATLRRPWTFIGCAIDTGGAPSGVSVRLQVIVGSMVANVPGTLSAVAGTGPQAFGAFIVAARAQLVVHNATTGNVRVRGVIWGMSDK